MRGHGQDDAVCIQPFSANLDLIAVLASPHGERGASRDELRLLEALEQTCNKGLHPRPEGDEGRIPARAPCRLRLEAAEHAAVLELERAQVGKRRP